ncbi:MAG: glycoside hydrolase family 127 protein, partial [Promethearchaeota archaeon]
IFPYGGKTRLQSNQTHARVFEQEEAVGHAVRAAYMYSGMADVAALTGDEDYIKALNLIWENVVSKKLYITGGIGNKGEGEAFGEEYKLPNHDAYCETCAAIANVFWNHRLFLLHGDAKYIDVMERTLYNGLISGYWFPVACCPSNIARFIPSIPRYIYAQKDNTIFVNLFISSSATVSVMGKNLTITQETEYPWEGAVKVKIALKESGNFTIAIRIPGWAQNSPVPSNLYHYLNKNNAIVMLQVNDELVKMEIKKGYVHINRTWKDEDVIKLEMPMPIRRVIAHDKVKNNTGKVALERGPIVYCFEWPDNDVDSLFDLFIDDDTILTHEYRNDLLNGLVVINGTGKYLKKSENGESADKIEKNLVAIPYYSWAHRGKGEMVVWINRNLKK